VLPRLEGEIETSVDGGRELVMVVEVRSEKGESIHKSSSPGTGKKFDSISEVE